MKASDANQVAVPLRPGTMLRLKRLWPNARKQGKEKDQVYRVGYYSRKDGLNRIWLVDAQGGYNWTADHEFVLRHFDILRLSKERSLYGRNRPAFGPLTDVPAAAPKSNARQLRSEAARATELLRGRVVKQVWRHRAGEVGIEFADGTRLFVDSNEALELSISGVDEESDDSMA